MRMAKTAFKETCSRMASMRPILGRRGDEKGEMELEKSRMELTSQLLSGSS